MYLSGKHSLLLLLPEGTPVNIFCHSTFLPVTRSSFLMELQDKQKLMPSVLFLSRLGIHPKSLSLWPVLTVCLSWASLSFLRGLPPRLHYKIKSACLEIVPYLNLSPTVRIGCSLVKWNGTMLSLLDLGRQCGWATTKDCGWAMKGLASCFQNLQGNISTSLWMARGGTGPLWGNQNCRFEWSLPAACLPATLGDSGLDWSFYVSQVSSSECPTSMIILSAFSVKNIFGWDFRKDLHMSAYILLVYPLPFKCLFVIITDAVTDAITQGTKAQP